MTTHYHAIGTPQGGAAARKLWNMAIVEQEGFERHMDACAKLFAGYTWAGLCAAARPATRGKP